MSAAVGVQAWRRIEGSEDKRVFPLHEVSRAQRLTVVPSSVPTSTTAAGAGAGVHTGTGVTTSGGSDDDAKDIDSMVAADLLHCIEAGGYAVPSDEWDDDFDASFTDAMLTATATAERDFLAQSTVTGIADCAAGPLYEVLGGLSELVNDEQECDDLFRINAQLCLQPESTQVSARAAASGDARCVLDFPAAEARMTDNLQDTHDVTVGI